MKGKIASFAAGSGLGYLVHYIVKETYYFTQNWVKDLFTQSGIKYEILPYPEALAIPFMLFFGYAGYELYKKYSRMIE